MYFPEPVLFELPVLPRVAKYVRVKLTDASGQPQPMLVTPDALGPGLMLWAMAQSEKVHLFTNFDRKLPSGRRYSPEPLTSILGIGIKEFHSSRNSYLLNAPELWVFSNMVDHMILNELVQHCQDAPDTVPMARIKSFCDHYDFSEQDFLEQSLRQMYLRHRKGVGAQAFAPQVTSQFQFMPMLQVA